MLKEKLIKEQISYTEEQQLQAKEIQQLKDKVFRQLIIYVPGYLLLIGGAVIIFLNAPGSYKTIVDPSANLDDDEIARMWKLAPYLSLFVFLMSTFFFGKIFYQSILPVLRDIKHKTKTLIFYRPEKTAMALFNKYYITTPLRKYQQIQVNADDFNSISDHNDLCLEVGPNSVFVLRLLNGEKELLILNNSD
jgi:hypothetical protein